MNVLLGYATFVSVTKNVVLALAAVAGAVCVVDWAVRTRRLSPFGGVARFFRARVDPLMLPVERAILRSGGRPSTAPWWSLVTVVVGGILLISLLGLIGGLLSQVMFVSQDPRQVPGLLLSWGFAILKLALVVRVISSWLPVSPYSKWIRWSYVLTEWMLAPLRRVIPRIGVVDITPIVAWLLLNIVQGLLGLP
jgi:YggT family protein